MKAKLSLKFMLFSSIFLFGACTNQNETSGSDGEYSSLTENSVDGYVPPADSSYYLPEDAPVANMVEPTPEERQTIILWDEDNIPAYNQNYQESSWDDDSFIPFIESYPASGDIKGAVLISPGGAFQFRSMTPEGYAVAESLSALGYQCFVVSYRLRPYSQEVAALDLARAIRYVRYHASDYQIDSENIALVGFSAGGILSGEVVLNNDGYMRPDEIDDNYICDSLDYVSAEAKAIGHIYSFYGRLSVSNNDVEALKAGSLPPTFYAYGTRDPFYSQFNQNVEAVKEAGVEVESHVFQNVGHGFGVGNSSCDWIPLFDAFLDGCFSD